MKNILTNKWFKFSLVLIIYLLWAYWVGSWWLLILVPVIFDIYITKFRAIPLFQASFP